MFKNLISIFGLLTLALQANESVVLGPFSKEMSDKFDSVVANIYHIKTPESILQGELDSKDLSDYYKKRMADLKEYLSSGQDKLDTLSNSIKKVKSSLQEYQTQIKILESVSSDDALFLKRYESDLLKTKDKKKIKSLNDAIENAKRGIELRQSRIDEYIRLSKPLELKIKELSQQEGLLKSKLEYATKLESNFSLDLKDMEQILDAISDLYQEALERQRVQAEYKLVQEVISEKEKANLSESKDPEETKDNKLVSQEDLAAIKSPDNKLNSGPQLEDREPLANQENDTTEEESDINLEREVLDQSKSEPQSTGVNDLEQPLSEGSVITQEESVASEAGDKTNESADSLVTENFVALEGDSLEQLEAIAESDFKKLQIFTPHEIALQNIAKMRIENGQKLLQKLQDKYSSMDTKSKIVENLKYLKDRIKSLFTRQDVNTFENRSIKSRIRGLKESISKLKIGDFLETSKYDKPSYLESFDIASIH